MWECVFIGENGHEACGFAIHLQETILSPCGLEEVAELVWIFLSGRRFDAAGDVYTEGM